MNQSDIIKILFKHQDLIHARPIQASSESFAPVNIAVVKYWGKRNNILNLPITSSLSITLPTKGTTTKISTSSIHQDQFYLNGEAVSKDSSFGIRLQRFLDLIRPNDFYFRIDTRSNVPTAAGLASSASGFCALVKALNIFFGWDLSESSLSILARMGSGSACRSFWNGFVFWEKGERDDGMDSFAKPYIGEWNDLCVGLMILSQHKKSIDSRNAMEHTIKTSGFYAQWPGQVARDLAIQTDAIKAQDFTAFGRSMENNALAMHSCMHTAIPSVCYWSERTIQVMQQIWRLRQESFEVYFTQDAGEHLKLFFLKKDLSIIQEQFENIDIVYPF